MKKFSADELKYTNVNQSQLAELVGVSRARINQLVKAGLFSAGNDGLPLVESLKDYYSYRVIRRFYDVTPAEYHKKFAAQK